MATTQQQKQGNPSQSHHLRLVRVERTAAELLDLELAERFAALIVRRGMRPRRFYKVAEGEMHPGRIAARLIDDAQRAGVPLADIVMALLGPMRRYAQRKYRVPVTATGEFRPAA